MHIPVLLEEVITKLNPQKGEVWIDGTLGGGGHTIALAEKIGNEGMVIGLDADSDAIRRVEDRIKKEKKKEWAKIICVQCNFSEMESVLIQKKITRVDGILLDLGFSSYQIEEAERGLSFIHEGPLDMRYDSTKGITAAMIVNGAREEELIKIFRDYGEERQAFRIAHAITMERRIKKFETTRELAEYVVRAIGKRGRIHPATKIFQALRIAVNDELGHLQTFLTTLPKIVRSGGRAGIIAFHSLEDRIVKNAFREIVKNGKGLLITKKPIAPSRNEQRINPRSRSAKLRVITIF